MIRSVMIALIFALAWNGPANASGPLVDVAWLKANLGKPGVVVLDVRSGGGLSKAGFVAAHIPGSVFTDYGKDGWREKSKDGVEGMLPSAAKLEALVGRLGIDNGTHVVLVALGRSAADTGAATRLYWTFKVLGHDKVSILDGGFFGWIAEVDKEQRPVNPLASGGKVPAPKTFKAAVRQDMIITRADVDRAVATKSTVLVDNRPHDFFIGLTKSPAAKRAGTIPGARSVPEGWLTENGGGTFRSPAVLKKLYAHQSVPTTGEQITFCNTGHWASLGWFVASELLGNRTVKMYDGSMAEWTQDPQAPMTQHITLQ